MWIIRMRFNLKTLIVVKKQINKSISDCFFVSFGCYVSVIVYYFIYFCAFSSNKWRINSNGWRRRVFCAGTRSRRWLDTSAQVGWRRRICTNFIHRPTYIRPVMNSFTDYASDYHLYVFETSWVSSLCVTQSILQATVLIFQLTFVFTITLCFGSCYLERIEYLWNEYVFGKAFCIRFCAICCSYSYNSQAEHLPSQRENCWREDKRRTSFLTGLLVKPYW